MSDSFRKMSDKSNASDNRKSRKVLPLARSDCMSHVPGMPPDWSPNAWGIDRNESDLPDEDVCSPQQEEAHRASKLYRPTAKPHVLRDP